MTPQQSRKIAYIIIVFALVSALVAFLYMVGKGKQENSEAVPVDSFANVENKIETPKMVDPEVVKKELEIDSSVSATEKALPQKTDSFINPDVMKYLNTGNK
jgi:hypothetical protein